MGLLGKLRGKRDEDDDGDDLDGLDEESSDDDYGSATGLLGRMRNKLKRFGGEDDDGGDDDLGGPSDDDGGSTGIFGRMRQKLKRANDDEDDDVPSLAPEDLAGGGVAPEIPAIGTSPASNAPVAAVDGENPAAQTQGGAPTAVYIVDGPEGGGAAPNANGEPEEGEEQKQDAAGNAGSGGAGESGLNLSDIFEEEVQVDVAFQDLVASVGEVAASDLATQLRELMSSLEKGG